MEIGLLLALECRVFNSRCPARGGSWPTEIGLLPTLECRDLNSRCSVRGGSGPTEIGLLPALECRDLNSRYSARGGPWPTEIGLLPALECRELTSRYPARGGPCRLDVTGSPSALESQELNSRFSLLSISSFAFLPLVFVSADFLSRSSDRPAVLRAKNFNVRHYTQIFLPICSSYPPCL